VGVSILLRVGATVVASVILIDLLTAHDVAEYLRTTIDRDAWSGVFSSISQVAATIVVASTAIPFLITTFSVHETTRALSRVHARNAASWLATATGCAATASAIYASFGVRHAADAGALALGLLAVTALLLMSSVLLAWSRLDPYQLANPALRQLTPRRVERFGLVQRSRAGNLQLISHNLDFRSNDPLGPFHELMRVAWGAQDRVLVMHMLETMLSRALYFNGAVYRPERFGIFFTQPPTMATPIARSFRQPDEAILVHALHYFVRNSLTSANHWGARRTDGPRRVFVLPLLAAHRSLARSDGHVEARMRLVDAIGHIAARTSHLPAVGGHEPFALLPLLAANTTTRRELDRLLPTVALARSLFDLSGDETFSHAVDTSLGPADRERLDSELQTPERILKALSASAQHDPWQAAFPLGRRVTHGEEASS
jgi:hypothetical protein